MIGTMEERSDRYSWLWDVDMGNAEYEEILAGRGARPGMDERWALVRLVEYAPYREIKRLLPRERFLRLWPAVSSLVRSPSRREGMDFVAHWLADRSRDGS